MNPTAHSTEVAIVGGGPSGAALAIRLAERGINTVIVERRAHPTWHAAGVFSSPLTRRHLTHLGLPAAEISELHRPISALELQTTRGVSCRLEYAHGFACGFDRVALDSALLDRARARGADARQGAVVRAIELPHAAGMDARLEVSATGDERDRGTYSLRARVVVGADGPSSVVARGAGVHATRGWFQRAGITFHRHDPTAPPDPVPMAGRFVFGHNWYIGIAPVPGARVNLGIVVPATTVAGGPRALSERLIASLPAPKSAWMNAPMTDRVALAGRLEHHVTRAAGPGFLLVGDAIGFIDPLTGEGLLRAFVTAELAADAIAKTLHGDQSAMEVYDRRVRSRFTGKNVVSWILQAFLANPPMFDYALRRLARRARLREQLTLVLTDQARATRVLDPRYLVRLLTP